MSSFNYMINEKLKIAVEFSKCNESASLTTDQKELSKFGTFCRDNQLDIKIVHDSWFEDKENYLSFEEFTSKTS